MTLPFLKAVYELSALWLTSMCYEEGESNFSLIRYLTLACVAFQTLFWAVFTGFQVSSLAGSGILHFETSRETAQKVMLLIFLSYCFNSAYLVTVERASLAAVLKYILAAFLIYFLFSSVRDFYRCSRTVSRNIDFVERKWDDLQSAQDSSSNSESIFSIYEDSHDTISIGSIG